jgi:hypothetical protein
MRADRKDSPATLHLEHRAEQADETPVVGHLMFTPPIDDDYWRWRVVVGDGQAIVGFPKFTTIGIGFAREEDWNTNLPYTQTAEAIFEHIAHNKGDDSIPDERCIAAIRMVQEAVMAERQR